MTVAVEVLTNAQKPTNLSRVPRGDLSLVLASCVRGGLSLDIGDVVSVVYASMTGYYRIIRFTRGLDSSQTLSAGDLENVLVRPLGTGEGVCLTME